MSEKTETIIHTGEVGHEEVIPSQNNVTQKFLPVRVVISDVAPEKDKHLTDVSLLHRRSMQEETVTGGYFGFENEQPFLDCPTWKPLEKTGVFQAVFPLGDGKFMGITNKIIYIVIIRAKPAQVSETSRQQNIMGILNEDIDAPVVAETATKPVAITLALADKDPTVGTEMENVLCISENTFTVTVTNDRDGTTVSRVVALTRKIPLSSLITKVEQFGKNAYDVETDGGEFVVLVEK